MRAARISDYNGPQGVITTTDAPKPEPAAGQVLVEVHAAGVNPFDNMVAAGYARQMAELTFPATLGGDVAGTVAALGEDVTDFEIGQPVFGQASALSGQGSFAEFTPVNATSVAPKPESVDYVTAAGLPLVASSAYQALEYIDLQPGQKILIHGGAGGIGSMAIQIAKRQGGYVITTAIAEDTDYVKKLGADEVIDYKTQDFTELVTDVDAVFDTVGGETNTKSFAVIKKGGSFVSMVADADDGQVEAKQVRYSHQFTHVTTERLRAIAELIDTGLLEVRLNKVFPLEQAGEALAFLKDSHSRGKVVIQVEA